MSETNDITGKIVGQAMESKLPAVEMVESNIMVIRDAYSWGAALVEAAEALQKWSGSITTGGATVDRTSQVLHIKGSLYPTLKDFEKGKDGGLIVSVCGQALELYSQENPFAVHSYAGIVSGDEGYQLLRYKPGDEYRLHVDVPIYGGPPSVMRRVLSLVSWPVADHLGGALSFPRQKVTISPEPGMVVVFPSSFAYPHTALPVRRGIKYSLVTWFFATPRPAPFPPT